MKKLKKIRLINWHRFLDETIDFDDSVLISGENGAGKSTLLDAIQLVITCSKNNFNKAAHEKGKRTLNTYIRCKTGREDHPFERTGEITSHIALEFYDEARHQPFIVGAVMDSASEEKEPNVAWYLVEKQFLDDELFLRGNRIKSISDFRSSNKKIRTFAKTQNEAKKMMTQRFGRLEEKFFQLIPKALAFRPIHDIKDFVYSYVLDEKEVNIENLKENVRSYQELERMLQDVKIRISELENIAVKESDVEKALRVDRHQEYYLAQVAVDLTNELQQDTQQKQQYSKHRVQEQNARMQSLIQERSKLMDTITTLKAELLGNEQFQALTELKKQETELKDLLQQNKEEMKQFRAEVKISLQAAEQLMEVRDVNQCIVQYAELLRDIQNLESLTELHVIIDNVLAYKKQMQAKVIKRQSELEIELSGKQSELTELQKRIQQLEKRKLTYPGAVMTLRDAIRKEFAQAGRSSEVRVLCELLEITNPAWQNAVEGYLNTQRFYLLVEPEDFDLAISVYDRLREQKKAYGAGLINTGKLEKYDQVPEKSLAEVVTSKSIWAKRYVNMVLGQVTRCQSYQELKKYKMAITRQCMRYQNHVVSAIRPEIFQTPYIGAEAYLRQLEQSRISENQLQKDISEIEARILQMKQIQIPLNDSCDINVKYHMDVLEDKRTYEEKLSHIKEYIKTIEKDTTILEKQIHLQELEKKLQNLDSGISAADREIGKCQANIRQAEDKLQECAERLKIEKAVLFNLTERLGEEAVECAREYEKLREGKELAKLRENYEASRKGNWTRKEKAENEMIQLMRAYKAAHDFGAPDSFEGYPDFEAELHKLKDSQLLTYEEKVQHARQSAEEEFQEQFLSRLQENIKQAQGELKELNKALADIHFSHERYIFRFDPSRKLRKYYDMIMDDFNLLQGESIFTGLFRENHREVIDELFEKLALGDEASTKVLEEYTDYRTYMDYDIEIRNDDGSYMLYSKVSREKSGGETQTPFYITVAASFMQLYRNSIGGDSIGLVMLDEAFNNMDDERIAGVLDFMTHANLQMIIAAPPDKIQYIAPSVRKVLLVLRDDKLSYVEDFTQI